MFSFKSIVLIAMAFTITTESHELVPAVAPLTVPAHVGYAQGIPQNVLPYASQVSVVNRAVATPFYAPLAAPLAAPGVPLAPTPVAAPFAAPYAARYGPYLAGPAPYALPAPAFPYAAPYAAPYAYSGGFLRTPFGVAPTFVR